MARDILCIPLTGTSIKRIFNFNKNICNYHQNHLTHNTIHNLILLLYDLKHEINKKNFIIKKLSDIILP